MAAVIVITGPPGAGKSTVARHVTRMFARTALVAGNDFFAFIDQGFVPPWTAAAHDQNGVVLGAAAATAGRMVAGGFMVVYSGVVVPSFLGAFAAASGLLDPHYVGLLPPEPTCIERVMSRVGHGFTDVEAARHMFGQFADADLNDRHALRSVTAPETIASTIVELVHDRSVEWHAPR